MDTLLAPVSRYYTAKLERFGAQPQGVDWNGLDGQLLRFRQLCSVLPSDGPFSLTDVGCGYGALLDFLCANYPTFDYFGIDISEAMIEAAAKLHTSIGHSKFVTGTAPAHPTDFAIASGIFNVKVGAEETAWRSYIEATLDSMHRFTTRGFAFNCLT